MADFKKRIKEFPRNMDNDIVVKIGEHSFPAHKEILMQRMDYFRAMFTVDMQERNQGTIQLDSQIIDPLAFNAILDFVYHFKATLTPAILASSLKAADFFCFEEMKEHVKRFIKKNFSPENLEVFTEAIMEFNLRDLEEDRRRYIISDPRLTPQELYVLSGNDTVDGDFISIVSKYDSLTQQWIELSPMPSVTDFFASTSVNHQIYICGGIAKDNLVSKALFIFDTNTQQWTELSSMNHPREQCSMAFLDGHLYVAGGFEIDDNHMSTVERYSIASNEWKEVSPMINRRCGLELVELDGFLYAIGGNRLKFVERYDPRTDRWEEISPTNDDNYYCDFGSAVLGGRIYIVDDRSFKVYDPERNKWETMPASAYKLFGRRLSVLNSKLFLTGGQILNGFSKVVTKTEYFDFEKGQWNPGKDMNVGRAKHGVAVITKGISPAQ